MSSLWIVIKFLLFPFCYFLAFAYSSTVFCEYRVYQYIVKNKNIENKDKSLDQKSYFVTSTLPPVSYQSYYGGQNSLQIDLLKTWICRGSTAANDKYCKGPNL